MNRRSLAGEEHFCKEGDYLLHLLTFCYNQNN